MRVNDIDYRIFEILYQKNIIDRDIILNDNYLRYLSKDDNEKLWSSLRNLTHKNFLKSKDYNYKIAEDGIKLYLEERGKRDYEKRKDELTLAAMDSAINEYPKTRIRANLAILISALVFLWPAIKWIFLKLFCF